MKLLSFALLVLAAAPVYAQTLDGFAGFSADGKRFAWVSRSNILPDEQNLYVIEAGSDAARSTSLAFDKDKAQATLKEGRFSSERRPLPPAIQVTANLTATPPTLTITRAGKAKTLPLDKFSFPPSDTWEVWGVDASGHFLAVHIYGKPVDGVFTKAKGGTLHFYRVLPLK